MSDKYPPESGRRRFVKGVVGSSALSAVAASSGMVLNTATSTQGVGGGSVEYVGIRNTDGPAPRGLPIVPLRTTDDGTLEGVWPEVETKTRRDGTEVKVAETEIGGFPYSSKWFQYCGVQTLPGAQPGADADNTLRVKGGYQWARPLETGSPVSVDDFDNYEEWGNGVGDDGIGMPLNVTWRNVEEGRALSVELLRSTEVSKMVAGEGEYGNLPGDVREFLDAATTEDCIAWLDKCTHFCCTPGFKSSDYPGAENAVYCQCHQSIYDPFTPVKQQFVALPRVD
ncbi:ubiquinol-cytochrome c reductase iron-sulfur subunit [Salinibaculum salinum]|uniref:ubiquinol-cytochrome c reductase iron-sulfur subunit n=1 Tax=Salinibaculum salinum TaxID=3131996 RepID=UPI0030EF008B